VLREIALTEGMEAIMAHNQFRRLLPPVLLEGPTAEEYRANFAKNTPQGYAATADALLHMEDLTERLGAISVPTWVCYGEHETEPIKYGDIYMARIPNCTRVILPDSGHFPIWDCTEPFLEAVHEFMEKAPVT
ncbi:MAG: alpha/beta hydrolase, partial [bacterium]